MISGSIPPLSPRSPLPPLPPPRGPGQDGGTASLLSRYEDVTQDGRIQMTALVPGLGSAVWRSLLLGRPSMEVLRAQGVVPILSRMIIAAEDRPLSVDMPIRYTGSFRFAREKGGDRLFANMWVEARAPISSTFGGPPPEGAPEELLGRIFAEHVITRPFAPPLERKVTRLEAPGLPEVPEDEHAFDNAEALIASTGGALDEAGEVTFAMMHTDSNQHINSLVYPRVFEETATRVRMGRGDRVAGSEKLLARQLEIRWRRPFFAGERASLGLRWLEVGEGGDGAKAVALGAFSPAGAGAGAGKPSCALRMVFR